MKLAFSTIGCPGWSWNEIFATAKDLGMQGIEVRGIGGEIAAPKAKPFQASDLSSTLDKMHRAHMVFPMLTSGAVLGVDSEAADGVIEGKAYIDLAEKLGCPYVRVLITLAPEPAPANIGLCLEKYEELCRYGADKGVQPVLETNGLFCDTRLLADSIEGIENAGVLWDVHHPYRYKGETPAETVENIGAWIRYVHVKDSVKNGEVHYRMMGYGDVPILDAITELKKIGYDGFISLEWIKRWIPDLQEPGIVFSHYASYMHYLMNMVE